MPTNNFSGDAPSKRQARKGDPAEQWYAYYLRDDDDKSCKSSYLARIIKIMVK